MRNYLGLFLLSGLLLFLQLDGKAEWQHREIAPTKQQAQRQGTTPAQYPDKQQDASDTLAAIFLLLAVGGLIFGSLTPFLFASSGLLLWSTVSLFTTFGTIALFTIGGFFSLANAHDPQGALGLGVALLFGAFTASLHGLFLLVLGLLKMHGPFVLAGGIALGLVLLALLLLFVSA